MSAASQARHWIYLTVTIGGRTFSGKDFNDHATILGISSMYFCVCGWICYTRPNRKIGCMTTRYRPERIGTFGQACIGRRAGHAERYCCGFVGNRADSGQPILAPPTPCGIASAAQGLSRVISSGRRQRPCLEGRRRGCRSERESGQDGDPASRKRRLSRTCCIEPYPAGAPSGRRRSKLIRAGRATRPFSTRCTGTAARARSWSKLVDVVWLPRKWGKSAESEHGQRC